MYKLVIKYFLLLIILSQLIFAQGNNTTFENSNSTRTYNSSNNNELKLTLSNSDHYLCLSIETNNQLLIPDPYLKFNVMMISSKDNLKNGNLIENVNEVSNIYVLNPFNKKTTNNKANKPKFNIISSFRENIHFAGFYDKYTIINFTPALNIKPFDFVNINASQIYSCFIPVPGIKEHFKTLFIQGAAILAVDNSIKLIFGANKMIPALAGYAAKNIIITLLKSSLVKKSVNQIYSYNNYSYSISINF